MALTANDVYDHFQRLISADSTLNLATKEIAFNEGYLYLLERMIDKANGIDELLVAAEDLTGTISQNYVALPSAFFKLNDLWKEVGTTHQKFSKESNISYSQLTDRVGSNFFNTSNTGQPNYFAVKKPRIYFDKHFAATSADAIKISYWQMPTEVDFYDVLALTSITGTFTVGETVTGGSTRASGTVKAFSSPNLQISSDTISLAFSVGETVTGQTSGAVGTISTISPKAQTLELGREYKTLLATAIAAVYFTMRRMDGEAQAKSETLDDLIAMRSSTDKHKRTFRYGIQR